MLTEFNRTSLPRWSRIALGCLVLALLPGCGTTYLLQAARGQWEIIRERRPIETVLADESTPEPVRLRLSEVSAARDFASRELALPDNGSYRSYADLGRPFVVWSVVAAPEFSVEPQRWCFPIAGCVAYRGYFRERSARAFAETMRRRGFDVIVGGVPAYSTLGRFADPVLNTMMHYGDGELAAIIFHELAHQVLYVPGDSEFNEAFAVAVERAGLERWLHLRGKEDVLERYRAYQTRRQEYIDLFLRRRAELQELYASDMPPEEMRERKRAIFAQLEADMRELERRQGVPSPYKDWLATGLNNAHLASVATYFDCVPGFERLLKAQNGDLTRFYAEARRISKLPRAERHLQLCESATPDELAETLPAGTTP